MIVTRLPDSTTVDLVGPGSVEIDDDDDEDGGREDWKEEKEVEKGREEEEEGAEGGSPLDVDDDDDDDDVDGVALCVRLVLATAGLNPGGGSIKPGGREIEDESMRDGN